MATPPKNRTYGTELAKIRLDGRKTDLAELLEKQVNLIEQAQAGMNEDFHSGVGGLLRALTDKDAKRVVDLTRAMESAVSMTMRLETHRKKTGEAMSQAEMIQAAVDKIKGQDPSQRLLILNDLLTYHAKDNGRPPAGARKDGFVPAMDALRALDDE